VWCGLGQLKVMLPGQHRLGQVVITKCVRTSLVKQETVLESLLFCYKRGWVKKVLGVFHRCGQILKGDLVFALHLDFFLYSCILKIPPMHIENFL
jgi:hypothetical protein